MEMARCAGAVRVSSMEGIGKMSELQETSRSPARLTPYHTHLLNAIAEVK